MIAVVSHDAGGAEIVSSYVRRSGIDCLYALEGPALRVFSRKLGVDTVALDEAIDRADWVLCGSSWQSDLEWRAIQRARDRGKRSIVFLDHWVHYGERFERRGSVQLPDEMWIGDDLGEALVRRLFPAVPVRRVPNPYFEDLADELSDAAKRLGNRPAGATGRVLFVTEPLSEHAEARLGGSDYWGHDEFDALRYFLENAARVGVGDEAIVIRPHPAEAAGKYAHFAQEHAPLVRVGGREPLVDELVRSDVVVGCHSMALVIGLLARKRVLSCIPPGGRACMLPHTEIESVRALLEASPGAVGP